MRPLLSSLPLARLVPIVASAAIGYEGDGNFPHGQVVDYLFQQRQAAGTNRMSNRIGISRE